MKKTILGVGKIKEKFLREGIEEYTKRMKHISIIETKAFTSQNPSEKEQIRLKDKEAKEILKIIDIKKNALLIALCIEGDMLDSIELSTYLENMKMKYSETVFIIGGSFGLSEQVIEKVDRKISFSKMTFPHQLMRLILVEQLYRAEEIEKNTAYHK